MNIQTLIKQYEEDYMDGIREFVNAKSKHDREKALFKSSYAEKAGKMLKKLQKEQREWLESKNNLAGMPGCSTGLLIKKFGLDNE